MYDVAVSFSLQRRTKSKEAGYVPAKYVKEIEPFVVKKSTKQKIMVPHTVKVKRKVKKVVSVERKKPIKLSPSPTPSTGRRGRMILYSRVCNSFRKSLVTKANVGRKGFFGGSQVVVLRCT